jgi:hypothetical protein
LVHRVYKARKVQGEMRVPKVYREFREIKET